MWMIWTIKLRFDVDILAFFGFATILATFSNIWVYFFQSIGLPFEGPDKFFGQICSPK